MDADIWRLHKDFVSDPCSYLIALNVDWFTVFDNYSVGAIYGVILNLPREIRMKPHNLMLLGVMPGPCEATLNINSYLRPIVQDLLQLYAGVQLPTALCPSGRTVRAILVAICADTPATRKCAGFTSHGSKQGCCFCNKTFSRKQNDQGVWCCLYGEFASATQWPLRSPTDRIAQVKQWLACTSADQQHACEQEYGVRFSELDLLPYWQQNPMMGITLDTLHVIFEGITKSAWFEWRRQGLISSTDLETIQTRVDNFCVCDHYCSIPRKFRLDAAYMTADEWHAWLLIFSSVVLADVLPTEHYNNWVKFVAACTLVCAPSLFLDDVEKAHQLFIEFVKEYEILYGEFSVKSNHHMVLHLRDVIKTFGPVSVYWTFGFERMNGIFQRYPSSGRSGSLEVEIMRRFSEERDSPDSVGDVRLHGEQFHINSVASDFISQVIGLNDDGRSGVIDFPTLQHLVHYESTAARVTGAERFPEFHELQTYLTKRPRTILPASLKSKLIAQLKDVYGTQFVLLDSHVRRFGQLTMYGQRFGSASWRGSGNRHVLVRYDNHDSTASEEYVGEIQWFFSTDVYLQSGCVVHLFATVKYLAPDGSRKLGRFKVWKANEYYKADFGSNGPEFVVPAARLTRKCIPYFFKTQEAPRLVACPVIRNLYV